MCVRKVPMTMIGQKAELKPIISKEISRGHGSMTDLGPVHFYYITGFYYSGACNKFLSLIERVSLTIA